jgi:beta-galactosidase
MHTGGFGAPLRDVLGLAVHEFLPLRAGEATRVEWHDDGTELPADTWQEDLVLEGAEVVASHLDGPAAGGPAITRHAFGDGVAWYVSTRLDVDALAPVLGAAYADAGVVPADLPDDVEVVVRHGHDADYVVAVNHTDADAKVDVAQGVDLLSGESVTGGLDLPAGGVAVVRTALAQPSGGDHHP